MLQIADKLVSLDLVEKYFCCDLAQCRGECCIEGDAGAPITSEELEQIKKALPEIYDEMTPAARQVVDEQGPAYIDEEKDLVTSIVNGKDCIFTTYAPGGVCLCLLEKAYREGRIGFRKPASCHLYPVRLKEYSGFTAVNYHRWKICKCAEVAGRAKGIRAYQFLEQPLVEKFGREWYDELSKTAEEWLRQNPK